MLEHQRFGEHQLPYGKAVTLRTYDFHSVLSADLNAKEWAPYPGLAVTLSLDSRALAE